MAAASSIARWLLNEASSGTTPTECADDEGSNTLTIDYSSGDAAWTSVAAGNGLDFTATAGSSNTAIAELDDIATNGDIGSSLDAVSEVSFILRATIDAGAASGSRLFAIGTNSGDTDLSIVVDTTVLRIRWDQESGGVDDTVSYSIPSGITTIGVSIDTTEAAGADRCKVYYDGSLETAAGGTLTLDSTLDNINNTNRYATIGNRPSQNRNIDGKIYYAELFTGVLTSTQQSDAHTALASGNDANWDADAGTTVNLTGQASTSGQGTLSISGAASTALAGQSSTSGQGALAVSIGISEALTGQASTVGQGAVIVTVGGVAIVPLTGQSSTVGQGTLAISGAAIEALSGQESTVNQGAISVSAGVGVDLTGQGLSSAQGTMSVVVDTVVGLSGLQSVVGQGVIGFQTANILTLTGQESSVQQGVIVVSAGGWTVQPDVSATWDEKIDASTTWTIQ